MRRSWIFLICCFLSLSSVFTVDAREDVITEEPVREQENEESYHHTFALPEYIWADDNSTATASVKCTVCGEEITETVNTEYTVITEPDCEKDGQGKYTASFEYELFGTVEKKVTIEAAGHSYQFTAFEWVNYSNAKAVFTCEHNAEHVLKIDAKIAVEETEDAYIFTATAEYEGETYTDTTGVMKTDLPESIELNIHETSATVNTVILLTASLLPETAEAKTVKWLSSDESIASVNDQGEVRGLKAGKAAITAATVNGLSDICQIRYLFNDVADESRYFFHPVNWALDNGITTGTSPVMFSPDKTVTRAQTATFLWRLAGEPEPESECTFNDISADRYYAKAVAWAAENGITTGYADGSGNFGPDDVCTREQIVTFLWRYAGKPEADGKVSFTDIKTGAYYLEAVAWAVWGGITTGLNDGTGKFGIGHSCTRGMCVTFLYRYANPSSLSADSMKIMMNGYVQNTGWTAFVNNDQVVGTTGKSLRLEGIRITLGNELLKSGNISAQAYIQNTGWLSGVGSGTVAGTVGKGLRMEAFKLSLTGELANQYDVYYRAYVTGTGWLGWTKNGGACGSTGWSKPIEALQICFAEKGSEPYQTGNAFIDPPVQDTPVYYSQRDSRWASRSYGSWTMYSAGCVPTSLAMIFSGLSGQNILPSTVADWLYNNTEEFCHRSIGGGGLCAEYAAAHWGYHWKGLGSASALADELAAGRMVIAYQGPGLFAKTGASHAIVMFQNSSGKTYVYDSWDSGRNGWYSIDTLFSQHSQDSDDIKGGYAYYSIYD